MDNASPALTDRLMREARLHEAAREPALVVQTLTPRRRGAGLKLLSCVGLPEGVRALLLSPRGELAERSTLLEDLVRDEASASLVHELLRLDPSLTQPALLAALAPGYTTLFGRLAARIAAAAAAAEGAPPLGRTATAELRRRQQAATLDAESISVLLDAFPSST